MRFGAGRRRYSEGELRKLAERAWKRLTPNQQSALRSWRAHKGQEKAAATRRALKGRAEHAADRRQAVVKLRGTPTRALIGRIIGTQRTQEAIERAVRALGLDLGGFHTPERKSLMRRAAKLRRERIEAHRALTERLAERKAVRGGEKTVREAWHDLVWDYDLEIDFESWDDLFLFYH